MQDINNSSKLISSMASTYSIAALDPETGEMGAAVQSHFFSVGTAVIWAEAGAGVIITQSVVNRQFGPDGLALLKKGNNAEKVLKRLLEYDPGRRHRQAAVLDAEGNSSVHTGEGCVREAGNRNGPYYSVQANMMLRDTVWWAMEKAFIESAGTLAERMLASLKAAERCGGDIRGRQSAALVVVKTQASGLADQDQVVDLRVDDNPDPLQELSRLLTLSRGYKFLEQGDEAMERQDAKGAMDLYKKACECLGDNPEALYWHGIALLNAGKTGEGYSLLAPLFQHDERWLELTRRLPESGLVSFDSSVLSFFDE